MAVSLETRFQSLTLNTVNPGLFHLSLNLLFQPDTDTLNERKKLLYLTLQDEHPTTHIVIRNLIAMINHRLPRRQNEVRKILEGIKEEHPRHLNTLANLEIVYKELHRQKDADICKLLKEKKLQSTNPRDAELQAQCVLEQGYALIFEESSNHEGVATQKLKDSLKILSVEHDKSSGDRQEYLCRALRHTQQAYSSVLSSMYCDRPDEKIQRKKESIERFTQGLKLLESVGKEKSIEYNIWKFCLGMAYNRFDYSISQQEDDAANDETRKELCGLVLQIFWDTISNLSYTRGTNLYIGRSYAYIGHLMTSRKYLLDEVLKRTSFKDNNFTRFVKNPMLCFTNAMKFRSHDAHVLNRYGRSLRNISPSMLDSSAKKWELLYHAHDLLTQSISILPHNNWFAYVTRMQTSRDLGILDINHAKEWLEEARQDGIQCFNSKATEPDLCILAKICQMLAKCPNIQRYGPRFVTDKEYIHEAVNYLNYALQLGGFVNWNVVYTLGTCLFEIEEFRTAIEWMKRAMHLSKKSGKSRCLTRIGEYILAFYEIKSTENDEQREYLLRELRFLIGFGKSKYNDIGDSISNLCKYQKNGMFAFTEYLVAHSKEDDAFGRELTDSCLRALQQWDRNSEKKMIIDSLRIRFENLPPPQLNTIKDLPSDSIHKTPDIVMPFSVDASIQHHSYQYDFFVSHSNVNKDWVNGYLLHQLETKLHDDDTAFKGCIADRDFTPGKKIIENIINAVESSFKIILIITPDFIESRWCDYEVDQALVDMLSKKKDNCVIPVLLEEIKPEVYPKKLSSITYLDLTDKTHHLQELMKLKRALLSEE